MKTRIVTLLAALLLIAAGANAQSKIATTLSVTVGNANGITAGDDACVQVSLTDADNNGVNGIVTISVKPQGGDAKTYNVAVVKGEGKYYVNNLGNDSYTITASYAGDDVYAASQTTTACNLYVPRITTSLDISFVDNKSTINVGETATVSITLNKSMNAVVFGKRVNHGEEFTGNTNLRNPDVALVNGKGTLELSGFDAGVYDIKVVCAGNDEINGSTSNDLTLTVNKIATTLTMADITAINAGEDAIVTLTATPNDYTGYATVTVDGNNYNVAISGGTGSCIIPNLAAGDYDVTASIAESNKYLGSTDTKQVTVGEGTDPAIVRNAVVTVTTTPDDYNGIVTVTIDGKNYNVAIINGTGEVVLPQLARDTYAFRASIAEDDKYLASSNEDALITSVPGVTFTFPDGQSWMTWCDDYAWLKPDDVKAYTISAVSGSTVTLAEVTDGNIPSHTPLLLEKTGDAVTPHSVSNGTGTGTLVNTEGTNATMWGNATDEAFTTDQCADFINVEGQKSYVLRNGQFILVDQNQGLAAHRCVLNVNTNEYQAPKMLNISVSDSDVTAVANSTPYTLHSTLSEWFTLDGRRLNGVPTQKGIYINGGRKVVVK